MHDKPALDGGAAPVDFPFVSHVDSIGERPARLKRDRAPIARVARKDCGGEATKPVGARCGGSRAFTGSRVAGPGHMRVCGDRDALIGVVCRAFF